MAAFKCHVDADYEFLDGLFPAIGPPDPGVLQFYPNMPYFEW
jgi:hypothetical protein